MHIKRGGARLEWYFNVWHPELPGIVKVLPFFILFVLIWDIGLPWLMEKYIPRKIREGREKSNCKTNK